MVRVTSDLDRCDIKDVKDKSKNKYKETKFLRTNA